MVDTFTTRLGLIMQAYGGNSETWGTELNNAMIALVDDSVAYDPITVNSDVTLTADNGLTNQVRRNLLVFTGDGGHTVTVKDVDRWYLVHNRCAADVTVKPDGGSGSVVRAGTCVVWCTDGSMSLTVDIPLNKIAKPEADVDFNGKKIVNLGAPSADDDGATKKYVDDAKKFIDERPLDEFTKPNADLDLNSKKIVNLATPAAPDDAATKGYIDTLAASSDLGTVAAVADEIRTLADIQDGTVATGTLTALGPIADEIVDVASVKGAVVQLAGMFIGASATDPATRLDGSPLQAGDFYLNTSGTPTVRVYDGNAWIPIEAVTLATPTEAETGTGNGVMTASLTSLAVAALTPRGYQEFLASGTWTKPADANWVYAEVCGGGGGGGSGRKGPSGEGKGGGAGGGAAPINRGFIAAADLPALVSVVVGASGAGGAPQSTNGTNGNSGSAGGDSSFAHFYSQGGAGGAGGGTGNAAGGAARSLYGVATANNPTAFEGANTSTNGAIFGTTVGGASNGSIATAAAGGSSIFSPGSGGGGGGEDTSNALFAGGNGGTTGTRNQGGGASAGVPDATAPTAGGDGAGYDGGGGGGSANGTNVSGARGGHGGRGAGGGGGGSCRNGTGNASGAGGNGGNGFVRVWWG